MKNGEGGFTLIELLAVVAIIGLLAAIGTVAMIGVLHRARQRRTMADMHTIALALESYNTDLGFYPLGDGGPVSAIAGYIEPTYLKPLPKKRRVVEPHRLHQHGYRLHTGLPGW